MVIDKPPGLVSTPSETQAEPTLADILNVDYGISLERGGLVHRLDKDTSGLILAAKNQDVFDKLQSQFAGREIRKEYLALVHGVLEKSGKVEGSIGRNPGNREKFAVLMGGREASTEYNPIKQYQMNEETLQQIFPDFNKIQMRKLERMDYGKFTLLSCKPQTGRTHQIRVHLKYINHPIVSDEKYGGRKIVRLDHRWCPRQFLHAARFEFKHPKSGEVMRIESQLPEDLTQAMNLLEAL